MSRREYKSGTRWCVWRWTDVVLGRVLYLRRLHLIQTPLFSVMLHWIHRPDPQPHLHDHPVSFLSFVLRGFYVEKPGKTVWFARFMRATDKHRIVWVPPEGCLTLVFAGPVVRSWGFHTERGWVGWREYSK